MHLRKRRTTTYHKEKIAGAPCRRAIEGQTKNPTSRRFHFFNVLLVEAFGFGCSRGKYGVISLRIIGLFTHLGISSFWCARLSLADLVS